MPVTKTAKRALRSSRRKKAANTATLTALEAVIRFAKRSKSSEKIREAISLADRAAKKHVIHKNKAARIKSTLSKLLPKSTQSPKKQKSKVRR